MDRFTQRFLYFAAVLLLFVTIIRTVVSWSNDSHLDHTSGVWLTLALDLNEGTFYRPLESELGYGGTRYLPLNFVLYAGLMKCGMSPQTAGYSVSLASILLLIAGVYALLKKLGVEAGLAAVSSLLVMTSEAAQIALLTIRGDSLASALNIWGIYACINTETKGERVYAGAFLFALAIIAKMTTVFGLMAVVFSFMLKGNSKKGFKLVLCTGLTVLLMAILINLTSQGRFLETFKAMFTGGTTLQYFVKAPFYTFLIKCKHDPGGLAFLILAYAAVFSLKRKELSEVPPLLLIFSTLILILIFGMEATDFNHLIDLHVASIVMFSYWLSRQELRMINFGFSVLAVATLVAIFPMLKTFRNEDTVPLGKELKQIARFTEDDGAPILTEDPMIAVIQGKQSYVLDSYFLQALRRHDSSFGRNLWQKMSEKSFGAIVLIRDPESEDGKSWYEDAHFGKGFVEELAANYHRARRIGNHYIYLPNNN